MSRLPRSCSCGRLHYEGERCPLIGPPLSKMPGWWATRKRILKRDGYRCWLCGGRDADTVDHVVARANGGTDDDSNLRAAHKRCNDQKGTK
jgi:hypothetical protein